MLFLMFEITPHPDIHPWTVKDDTEVTHGNRSGEYLEKSSCIILCQFPQYQSLGLNHILMYATSVVLLKESSRLNDDTACGVRG
jgi:hypothetical protein